jgi:hypothetical protein
MTKNDVTDWVEVIEQGIRYKETYGNSNRWSTYRDYGRGIFPGFNGSSEGILPFNITFSMQRSMVPNIYFRNPYINVTPTNRPGADIQSRVVEAVDNYLMGELDIKGTFKTMIQDAFYTSRGICKLGYDGLWGQVVGLGGDDEKLAEKLGIPFSQFSKDKKVRVEYNSNVKSNTPWVERIMPECFIVPYGVRTLDDCPWVDHVVLRYLSDVKADRKYTNTEDLSGSTKLLFKNTGSRSQYFNEMEKYEELVEIHEIHDFKRKELKCFAAGYDKWIRKPIEDVLQIEGLPFVDLCFNEDGEYYWGSSDVQIIEPQQLEINEARTQAMLHRRIALVKFLVQEAGMDKSEVEKMLRSDVGPVAFTKGIPSQVVSLLQPHIPADLTQWSSMIEGDVRSLLGQGRQQTGEAPAGRRTAAEMQMVQANSDIRMDERRDAVADALVKVMRKVNQIIFERWDQSKVIPIVGYDGAKYWVQYTGKENAGEYSLKVDVESMTPKTKNIKKREIIELVQALGNNPRANIDYLLRMLLREYDWIDAMKVFPDAQETMTQPMTQEQFTQQQQKLLANRPELQKRSGANSQSVAKVI